MSNPSPRKLKAITVMFFVAGAWGFGMEFFYFQSPNFLFAALGVVNLMLGIFMVFRQRKDNNTQIRKKEK